MNDKTYVSLREAMCLTGLGNQTIRKLADTQTIQSYKTPTRQRRFNKESILKFCNAPRELPEPPRKPRRNYLYARVSSKKQMDDLSRQIKYLQEYRPEYNEYYALEDIGSGINFKRKGLQTLLDACLQGTIGEVIIAHRDRLSRFGYDLLECLVRKAGGKIIVLEDNHNKSTEQELAEDLLSIVHIYSCRQMGKRSYTPRTNRDDNIEEQENQIETIQESTTENQ
jgi:predicted site-specific integrase-resolvase